MQPVDKLLQDTPVVPVLVIDDVAHAKPVAEALCKGGANILEVTMRTDCALDAIEQMAQVDGAFVGAGTVLTKDHAEAAIDRGAQFIVSPGLVDETAAYCMDRGVPIYAGVMTAGETQRAYAMGLRTVKFFPASLAGGVPMLKALSSVFREMRFMPTGGVSASNLGEFLALPSVVACGGSWLTPKDAMESGNYEEITRLAAEALKIARAARS